MKLSRLIAFCLAFGFTMTFCLGLLGVPLFLMLEFSDWFGLLIIPVLCIIPAVLYAFHNFLYSEWMEG